MTTAAGSRLDSIQALRGIAALAVVLFHAQAVARKYLSDPGLLPDALAFGQTGVDLFFVISGFVMVLTTAGSGRTARDAGRFLLARSTRIYPVYWVYLAATMAVFLIRPEWVNASQGHRADLVSSFLLLPSRELPLVMVAWSLVHELWFYLVFAGLLLLPRRWLPAALTAWALAIALATLIPSGPDQHPAWLIVRHPYTVEFILGAAGALALPGRGARPWPLLLTLGVALTGLFAAHVGNVIATDALMRAAILGALYVLLVSAAVLAEQGGLLAIPRFLTELGDRSYTIYLSHVLVLSAGGRLWTALPPDLTGAPGGAAMAVILMLAGVLIWGRIGYQVIERPLSRLHRLAAGKR
jgi:peptidoglycan/LPS O-acetylase OafA/YrhL